MVNVKNEHADKTSVIVHSDNYTNNECPIHRVSAIIQQGFLPGAGRRPVRPAGLEGMMETRRQPAGSSQMDKQR